MFKRYALDMLFVCEWGGVWGTSSLEKMDLRENSYDRVIYDATHHLFQLSELLNDGGEVHMPLLANFCLH